MEERRWTGQCFNDQGPVTLFYINTSNPLGQSVLNQQADEIAKQLHDKGVMEKEEEITIRTMGLEPVGIKGG